MHPGIHFNTNVVSPGERSSRPGKSSSPRGRVLGTFTTMILIDIPGQAETAPLSFQHAAKKLGHC